MVQTVLESLSSKGTVASAPAQEAGAPKDMRPGVSDSLSASQVIGQVGQVPRAAEHHVIAI